MNVLFHITTALGATVLLTDTVRLGTKPTLTQVMPTSICVFSVGIISHGALDFIPHCYPINSKVDAIAGLLMILAAMWLTNRHFRAITGLACLGSIFPDIVDLGPKIINKQLNLQLSLPDNIFPWHWQNYSGSIYNGTCSISTVNHLLLLLTVGAVLWTRRADLSVIIKKS